MQQLLCKVVCRQFSFIGIAGPVTTTNMAQLKRSASAVARLDEAQMSRRREVLLKYGYGAGVLNECPDLLSLHSTAIENYILIMQETGFTSIRPYWLATYPSISKKSLTSIKKSGLISEDEKIIEKYFHLLELPREICSNILSALPENPNQLSLMALRLLILEHFLAYKLKSEPAACRNLITKYPRSKHRSYAWIVENIKILRTEYDFSQELIMKHGGLIAGNPHNFRNILTTVDTLGGKPLKDVVTRRPKILMVQASSLIRSKDILRQHGIKDEAIAKYPEVFTLSPDTIAARLKSLDETPELHPFKTHPRVGRILYYFEKVKKRLDYLSSLDVSGVSLHILSVDKDKFSNYIKKGDLRNKGGDIVHFIAENLGLPKQEVRDSLSVHPHWLQVPTLYAKEVLLFLRKSYSIEQIRSVLPILLYPVARVEAEIELQLGEDQSGASAVGFYQEHPYFLHLILYRLEKEFHFTGDGIWTGYHQLRHEMTEVELQQNLP